MTALHLLHPITPAGDRIMDGLIVDDGEPAPLAELLRRTRDGDSTAFEELYRRTSSRIFGMTYRVLRSSELASEVTQEVYVEVWQQADRYDPARGSVLAWMTTTAHRRAVDRVRSVSKATARDEKWGIASLERETDDVYEQTICRMDARRVRSALGVLTPLQRDTVVALYLDGRTQTDLAAELGASVSTVKTRIRDALTRLRTTMVAA
ncbi:MAG: sigma-70 family RNA polymerase sigma factor [Propionibacteriaceae bacterium]